MSEQVKLNHFPETTKMVELLRTYNKWRRDEIEGSMDDLGLHPSDIGKAIDAVLDGYDTLRAQVKTLQSSSDKFEAAYCNALNGISHWAERAKKAEAECGGLREALDHIEVACQRSRTSTRRLRWIEQRCQYALEGKEYTDDAFDLPKLNNFSHERLTAKISELKAELAAIKDQEPVGVMFSDGEILSKRALGAAFGSACASFIPLYALSQPQLSKDCP